MKILITGLTGYIGKDLQKIILNKNYQIAAISRKSHYVKNIEFIRGDLKNLNKIKKKIISFNPDILIHLAWYEISNLNKKNSYLNYRISKNLINHIINFTSCQKIIVTGSCLEYKKKNGVCNENSRLDHQLPFAKYKNKIMKYTQAICKKNNVLFYWFRLFYVIGQNQRSTSLIPSILKGITNKKVKIKNSLSYNDYVPIEKVSKTLNYCIINSPSSGIYNIGSGRSINYKEIIAIINRKLKNNNDSKIIISNQKNKYKKVNFWSGNSKYNKTFDKIKTKEISFYICKMVEYYNN